MGNMAAIPFMCPGDVVDAMLRGQPHQRVIGRMKADFVDTAAMQVECGKFGREAVGLHPHVERSDEHTSELQSLLRTSSAVVCLKQTTHESVLRYLFTTSMYL